MHHFTSTRLSFLISRRWLEIQLRVPHNPGHTVCSLRFLWSNLRSLLWLLPIQALLAVSPHQLHSGYCMLNSNLLTVLGRALPCYKGRLIILESERLLRRSRAPLRHHGLTAYRVLLKRALTLQHSRLLRHILLVRVSPLQLVLHDLGASYLRNNDLERHSHLHLGRHRHCAECHYFLHLVVVGQAQERNSTWWERNQRSETERPQIQRYLLIFKLSLEFLV